MLIWALNFLRDGWMLVEEYSEINKISFSELKKVWKKIKNDALLIGGWAAHFLSNNQFKSWKKIDYIGSKDIDFGIRSRDIEIVTKKLKELGYTPINFRFYKIFDKSTKRPLKENIAKKLPLFEIFYLYVDIILDEKIKTTTIFFSDPVIKFCLENNLWIKIKNFKVIRPEPLILTKLRILDKRDEEKRIKDILDSIFVLNFSDFDLNFFKEISSIYKITKWNKKIALNVINSHQLDTELSSLRFDANEIRNLRTTFISTLNL
jgi:hypothetical protein